MDWKPYKNCPGQYAEHQTLVLSAWETGAWSVHDAAFRIKPRNSELLRTPVDGIEAAKKLAEQAAIEMLTPQL